MRRVAVALGFYLLGGCHTAWKATFAAPRGPGALDETAPFLKCHMYDGRVYVLESWEVNVPAGEVWGRGYEYDAAHDRRGEKRFQAIKLDTVALLETNEPRRVPNDENASIAILATLSVASAITTVACAANPKACFGSCPTFYADDGDGLALQAEGFSASVARSLETTDVDAMWTVRPSKRLDVLMTNDALETHAIDRVRILAAPRPPGQRVLRAGDDFWQARRMSAGRATAECDPAGRAECGDISRAVAGSDGNEYHSPASATDLAEKETIHLSFDAVKGRRGLLIVARNSLLETFLFYQALAFMGRRAGGFIAALEREGAAPLRGVGRALGDIEVRSRAGASLGAFREVGPIAREAELVVLAEEAGPVELDLVLTRGSWRIDQLALVELGDRVRPAPIDASDVLRNGVPDARARLVLRDADGRRLITRPGDAYTLRFELPEGDHELFLESRGYYYEWIRTEWLADESALEALRFFAAPEGALRALAPKFKRVEAEMEPVFWSSRVARKPW